MGQLKLWTHDFWRTITGLWTAILLLLAQHAASQSQPTSPAGSGALEPIKTEFECTATNCCDQHEWCQFWASIGECALNKVWMVPNCQLACGTCADDLETERLLSQNGTDGSNATDTTTITDTQQQLPLVNGPVRCEQISLSPTLAANVSQITVAERLIVPREAVPPHSDIRFRRALSLSDITASNVQFGCVPQLDFTDCRTNMCYNLRYRTMDGTCNNLHNPLAGAAFTKYRRLLDAQYDNEVEAPTSSLRRTRPSAREATRFLLSSSQLVTASGFNGLIMQWGQFLSHDLAKTTLLPSDQCSTCQNVPGRCFNVPTDPADPRFGQFGCLRVTRSSPICGTGQSSAAPRQQMNENTAFIDASMVYGSSVQDSLKLRDGPTGFLRMVKLNNDFYPPFNQAQCHGPTNCNANFETGDNRANIFVGLASMHTLFAREHNRLVNGLRQLNPNWSSDRLYQESRKILGAVVQHITFTEYLPKLLGDSFVSVLGNYTGYDPKIDPSIANEFVTAAFRLGHGMIQEMYNRLDENGNSIQAGPIRFDEAVFKSSRLLFEGGIDPLLRGMMTSPVKRPQRITTAVTERLFGSTDLASTNIQRGRDHGLPSYNKWREFCGLGRATNMEQLQAQILDQSVRQNLARGFTSPDNIDLYVGCMLEDPIINGLVGPTLACLIGEQFTRLRDGDRFWYENSGVFTEAQLAEIYKSSLSRVLCDNGKNWLVVPEDAFDVVTGTNLVTCNEIPAIDLRAWKD